MDEIFNIRQKLLVILFPYTNINHLKHQPTLTFATILSSLLLGHLDINFFNVCNSPSRNDVEHLFLLLTVDTH